jgi:hypothetical protein
MTRAGVVVSWTRIKARRKIILHDIIQMSPGFYLGHFGGAKSAIALAQNGQIAEIQKKVLAVLLREHEVIRDRRLLWIDGIPDLSNPHPNSRRASNLPG